MLELPVLQDLLVSPPFCFRCRRGCVGSGNTGGKEKGNVWDESKVWNGEDNGTSNVTLAEVFSMIKFVKAMKSTPTSVSQYIKYSLICCVLVGFNPKNQQPRTRADLNSVLRLHIQHHHLLAPKPLEAYSTTETDVLARDMANRASHQVDLRWNVSWYATFSGKERVPGA